MKLRLTEAELDMLKAALRLTPLFGGTRGWDSLLKDDPERAAHDSLLVKIQSISDKTLDLDEEERFVLRDALTARPFNDGTEGFDHLPLGNPERETWESLCHKLKIMAISKPPDRRWHKKKAGY